MKMSFFISDGLCYSDIPLDLIKFEGSRLIMLFVAVILLTEFCARVCDDAFFFKLCSYLMIFAYSFSLV